MHNKESKMSAFRNIIAEQDEESSSFQNSVGEKTTTTAIGKVKTLAGLEAIEWIFLAIAIINVLVAFALNIDRLVEIPKNWPDYTFAIIVFINIGFCLFYAIHGVLREREFELYAFIIGIAVIFVYIVIDLIVNSHKRTALKWGRFGAIIGLGLPNIYFAWRVARDFGYLAFKTVGAAVNIHRMYRYAGMFSCLLKFDLQLAVSLFVLVITKVSKMSGEAIVTVSVGVPLQLFWSTLGWLAMRKENMSLVMIFFPMSLLEPAYLFYKIAITIKDWDDKIADGRDVLVYSFFGAAALALIVRVLVLFSLKRVVKNFGHGLKESVFNLPVTGDEPPIFPRKRNTAKCCGIIWRGPLG
ncbi:uncharacterized protein [Montipora capricornis]|uniref:uncharacterized protein n=1 Tax=Montipora capricornis TaxID=246305 RepID=UPI0035F13E61